VKKASYFCLSMLLFWIMSSGCDLSGSEGKPSGASGDFLPHTVQLQPSFTRLGQEPRLETQNRLEVYVRLLDQFGDPLKAAGVFRFELYEFRPLHRDPRGRRLAGNGLQEFDLSEVARNQKNWDNITQSYYFQLVKPDLPANWQKFVLSVTFINKSGYRLEDTLLIERKDAP